MRQLVPAALAAGGLLLTSGASGAVAAPGQGGLCAGLDHCHVVARPDVTGDGERDTVALVRHGENGAERGSVTVRVRTAEGRVISTRRRTAYWHGALWQGAGLLDGRGGRDLVVGRTQGAHAQEFTVLTWRKGELVVLNAPGKGRWWWIDSAVWINAGWQHRKVDDEGLVRKRVAMREGNAAEGPIRGKVSTFRWTRDGWDRVNRRTIYSMSDRRASRWGGWRVQGIHRW